MVYRRAVSGPLAEKLFCLATLPTLPHIRFLVSESLEYIPYIEENCARRPQAARAQSPQCTVYTRDFQKQKPDVPYTPDSCWVSILSHLVVFMIMCASTFMPLSLPPLTFLAATLVLVELTLVLMCDNVRSNPLDLISCSL